MERLAERYVPNDEKKGIAGIKVFESENIIPLVKVLSGEYLYPAIEKLAAYEDLEEQGLLVRLPCKVGDTVYKITRFCSGGIRDCGYSYECSECPEYKPFIEYIEFKIPILKNIGKNVFLTREEAEKELEEMGKNGLEK